MVGRKRSARRMGKESDRSGAVSHSLRPPLIIELKGNA